MYSIYAHDENNGISKEGKIPWKYKIDMDFFKKTTKGHVVIMGRKTFEDTGVLSDRFNIVLSKTLEAKEEENLMITGSILTVLRKIKSFKSKKIFVIGGSEVFRLFEEIGIKGIYETNIKYNYETDNIYTYNTDKDIKVYFIYEDDDLYIQDIRFVNEEEEKFLQLVDRVIENGTWKNMRANRAISIFGSDLKFELKPVILEGIEYYKFPISTHRSSPLKIIFEELIWIIRGQTDSNILKEKTGVNVWEKNTTREFLDKRGLDIKEGDIGKSYGYQMRFFNDTKDQLTELIHLIRTDPNSNRLIINLWNPCQIDQMSLPPCGFCYQFDVTDNRLNCKITQRSSDIVLAGFWNISSCCLFVLLLSKMLDLKPGYVIWSCGNVHIYENNFEKAKQMNRKTLPFPLITVKEKKDIWLYEYDDLELLNYNNYGKYDYAMNM